MGKYLKTIIVLLGILVCEGAYLILKDDDKCCECEWFGDEV